MKSVGGSKRRSSNVKLAAIIGLLAVIIVAAVWLISSGDGITGRPDNKIDTDDSFINTDGSTRKTLLNESKLPDATSPVSKTDERGKTIIALNGDSASVNGSGALTENGYVLINRAGVYELSGTLNNGRIVVSAKGEDVVLILNGVNVTSDNSSALFVHKANSVTLIANKDTQNVFTDGESYDFTLEYSNDVDKEPNAAIFSKADLILRGTGTITVNGRFSAGIISKDNLKIINTTVIVNAVNNGINGKDSLTVQNSTVKINSDNDGIRSTKSNDPKLGYAVFKDSNIYIVSGGDGIQIETGLTVDGCSMSIVSGGGAFADISGSQKGIKCSQGYVTVNSGYIVMDCADDAVNAAGNVTVNGGVINISSGDDAVHSDRSVIINGGNLVATKCSEGLEGMTVELNGGDIYINSKSDALNASGGSDDPNSSAFEHPFAVNDSNNILISGGYIYLNSEGDGIDSNGNIKMSGGTLIINGPTSGNDGAIDYNGAFEITGGTILAVGSRAMAQAPSIRYQNCVSVTFDKAIGAGEFISVSCGGKNFVFKTEKQIENMVFSSEILLSGKECIVSYGGKYSNGDSTDNVYKGGRYSGGKDIKLTLDDTLCTYGQDMTNGPMGNPIGAPMKDPEFGEHSEKKPSNVPEESR